MSRRRAPAQARQLAGADRAIAWASVGDDWVVATRAGLALPAHDSVTWDQVIRAAWDEPVLEVQIPEGIVRLVLDEPGHIPEVVNERVKASVVIQHHVPLVGDKGVRIVARRKPGSTDISWRVTFDPGLDPGDPVLRAAADEALAELRANIGL